MELGTLLLPFGSQKGVGNYEISNIHRRESAKAYSPRCLEHCSLALLLVVVS